MTIIKVGNFIFGGYATESWESEAIYGKVRLYSLYFYYQVFYARVVAWSIYACMQVHVSVYIL